MIECLEFEADIYTMDIVPQGNIEAMAKAENIQIKCYDIIYKIFEDLTEMNDVLAVENNSVVDIKGAANVQQIFDIQLNKSGKFDFWL